MLLKIHPENPELRKIRIVVECLKDGGVIIFPTDTLYSLGCDLFNHNAIEKVSRIKNIDSKKANYSILCYDLSHLSDFVFNIDTPTYRIMKRALPGPYTFILKANNNVPKIFKSKRKTIGIRVPDSKICRMIINELGNPVTSTSVKDTQKDTGYILDPEIIHDKYSRLVDIVIDGGIAIDHPSTILDCSDDNINIVREGKGSLDIL